MTPVATRPRFVWSIEEMEKLIQLWSEGKTIREIAEELDRPVPSINSKLHSLRKRKEVQIPFRSRGPAAVDVTKLNKLIERLWPAGKKR